MTLVGASLLQTHRVLSRERGLLQTRRVLSREAGRLAADKTVAASHLPCGNIARAAT